jgi:hypothetical protein
MPCFIARLGLPSFPATARPEAFASLLVSHFEITWMNVARLIVTIFTFLSWLFVNEGFATEAIGIVGFRVLFSMGYTVLYKGLFLMASVVPKSARWSIPFFPTASPAFRPHAKLTSEIVPSWVV